jgi:hypothetical protein
MMKSLLTCFACVLVAVLTTSNLHADLVAGWDFQTTANGGTAAAASPNTPKQYTANFGSGAMFLNGLNGSSDWFVPASGATNTELNAFGGTALNAGPGFSTTTSGAASLAIVNQTANSKNIVFRFSMAGFQDLDVSYATQRTSTGFTTQSWSYSTDGVAWTNHDAFSTIAAAFEVKTLSRITALNGAADAYLRLTVTGASAAAGNNRLDNIQFNASAVPEPTSILLASTVALGGAFYRFGRRR